MYLCIQKLASAGVGDIETGSTDGVDVDQGEDAAPGKNAYAILIALCSALVVVDLPVMMH